MKYFFQIFPIIFLRASKMLLKHPVADMWVSHELSAICSYLKATNLSIDNPKYFYNKFNFRIFFSNFLPGQKFLISKQFQSYISNISKYQNNCPETRLKYPFNHTLTFFMQSSLKVLISSLSSIVGFPGQYLLRILW